MRNYLSRIIRPFTIPYKLANQLLALINVQINYSTPCVWNKEQSRYQLFCGFCVRLISHSRQLYY